MLTLGDLERIADEAAPAVVGGVVHRISREDDTWVVLLRLEPARHARDRVAIEIGLAPEGARLVAATGEQVGADDPAAKKARKDDAQPFLSRLRRVLPGCRVEKLSVVEGDRIVFVDFLRVSDANSKGTEETTGETTKDRELVERPRLAVELLGRATNLVLVDRGPEAALGDAPEIAAKRDRILAALRPGRGARELEPGTRYELPPRRVKPEGESAPEIAFAEISPDPATLALSSAFREAAIASESASEAQTRHQELVKAARRGLARAKGLREKLEKERAEAVEAEKLRQRGELLKANAANVKKGMTSIEVQDFFSPEPDARITIELDPLEPVMDQARALFKRAKKLDRGLIAIETRLGAADGEAQDLERIVAALEASDPEDEAALDDAEKELRKLGCAPRPAAPPAAKKPRKDEPTGPRKFTSRDGFLILVGRSNTENDHLTIRVANGHDLFFHVRGFPGSHVIVRAQKDKTFPLETLLDASALAVHYSKVRGNTRADVSYTPRKYVRKPRGAKPGLVEISNEKTIRPDGDPARLSRLLATAGRRETDDDAGVYD